MNVSISNLAWDVKDDEHIVNLLIENNINSIDLAPAKYFPNPLKTKETEIIKLRDFWNSRGINIIGLQALLFGSSGLNIFGSEVVRDSMLTYLKSICRIGSLLGAKHLVFGSPKNRDTKELNDMEVSNISISFFRELGRIAAGYGVEICIEPNPEVYGSNFITNSKEAATLVEQINHPNIKMQLDTGSILINNENLESILVNFSHLIGHVHLSEPFLIPYGQDKEICLNHSLLIKKYLQNHSVTIEMLNSKCNSPTDITNSIKLAKFQFKH